MTEKPGGDLVSGESISLCCSEHDTLKLVNEIIFEVREDEAEGGYVARALGQSIVTQADMWEDLRAKVKDAVRCLFEEGQAPRVIRLHRVLEEVLALT
jgi:Zn ribbon nucleic-acid-binding protein